MLEKIKKYIPSKRKLIQLYCALLFNANLKGFVSGNIYTGSTKKFCVPGINCYSCPGAVGACPLGSLQGAISADKSTLYYVGGILLLYSILFGRMICGWFCPFGLIQELLYKIKTPKWKKSRFTRILSYLKYVILVVFVFIIPISYALKDVPFPAFCKFICPAGTIEGGLLLLSNSVNASYFSMLGPIFTWKFLLMISLVVGCVFAFRFFCRFVCPLGALYGLFNRFSIFGIRLNQDKCINCNLCIKHCKMDIHHVGDMECISCGECIPVCPTGAISFKGAKVVPAPNVIGNEDTDTATKEDPLKKRRFATRLVVTVVMVVVLIGAIARFWNESSPYIPDPGPGETETSGEGNGEDIPQGNTVGTLCYGYDLEIVTKDGVPGDTIDPVETGKVTVINFWGTWCTPCVAELPYFEQVANENPDTVQVIAVHSSLSCETAPEYLGKYYPESLITFAQDYALDATGLTSGYYTTLGGRGTYPYTVILDEEGIIQHIFVSSLTYEELNEAVQAALNK